MEIKDITILWWTLFVAAFVSGIFLSVMFPIEAVIIPTIFLGIVFLMIVIITTTDLKD